MARTEKITKFRQADVTRAVKGARAAGMDVRTIKIDADGTILLATGTETDRNLTSYDAWKAENG